MPDGNWLTYATVQSTAVLRLICITEIIWIILGCSVSQMDLCLDLNIQTYVTLKPLYLLHSGAIHRRNETKRWGETQFMQNWKNIMLYWELDHDWLHRLWNYVQQVKWKNNEFWWGEPHLCLAGVWKYAFFSNTNAILLELLVCASTIYHYCLWHILGMVTVNVYK